MSTSGEKLVMMMKGGSLRVVIRASKQQKPIPQRCQGAALGSGSCHGPPSFFVFFKNIFYFYRCSIHLYSIACVYGYFKVSPFHVYVVFRIQAGSLRLGGSATVLFRMVVTGKTRTIVNCSGRPLGVRLTSVLSIK